MSWIKDNKFAAVLGGVTLLVAIVLGYVGISYRAKYGTALQEYQDAATEVEEFENLPLYPSDANRDGKTKALNEYRTAITGFQSAFEKFRPKELKNSSPQDFTGNAKSANEVVTKAFAAAKTKLPDGLFIGFETYSSGSLAREEATGILNYQLDAIKELMLALAKAAPSQLQNLYRPKSPEEDGLKWIPGPDDSSRAYPLEVTFKGTEKSAREFMDFLANSPTHFYVVRTLRIANEKLGKAPNKSDSKFEVAPPAGGPGKLPGDPFGGAAGFVLPTEDPPPTPATGTKPVTPATGTKPATPATDTKPATPATGTPPATPAAPVFPAVPAAPAAAIKPAASGRILNQILGDEEIQVFLRIDVLQFLPAKELPVVPK
jgi:hypothetical protein